MKANAPDKIYIPTILAANTVRYKEEGSIEYIRTDAFVEKVESFLNKKDDRDFYTIGYIKRHLKEIIKEVGL